MVKKVRGKPFKKGHKNIGGRKPGSKNKETIARDKALEVYQQEMLKLLLPLVRSQQQLANGLVVVLRPGLAKNQKGKLVRSGELKQVKDPDEIERLFNSKEVQGQDYHIVFAKDPNVKALSDIFDRVFGKPKEQLDINLGWKRKKLEDIQDKMNLVIDYVSKEAKKK
jgi:hypothetical protein